VHHAAWNHSLATRIARSLGLATLALLAGCASSYEVVETIPIGGDRPPVVASPDFLAVDDTSLAPGEAIAVVASGGTSIVHASIAHLVLERRIGEGAASAAPASGGGTNAAPPTDETTLPPDRVAGFALGAAAARGWASEASKFERVVRIPLDDPTARRIACRFCLTNDGDNERVVDVDLFWRSPGRIRIVGTVDAAVVCPSTVRQVLLYVPYIRFAAMALGSESYVEAKPKHKVVNADLLRVQFEGVKLGTGHGLIIDCEAEVLDVAPSR